MATTAEVLSSQRANQHPKVRGRFMACRADAELLPMPIIVQVHVGRGAQHICTATVCEEHAAAVQPS